MLVAAIDTATPTLSCALLELRGGAVEVITTRTDRQVAPGAGHGVRLPGALADLLGALGRKVPDVEGFAVGLGPGSFTGLRIALATWKGLAYANRRPIAGVSSLAAMALEAAAALPAGSDAVLVPLLDARKGEVYAGFYRVAAGGVTLVRPEEALPPAALAVRLDGLGAAVGFGEGYAAHEGTIAPLLPRLDGAPSTPSGDAVGRLAASRLDGAAYDEQALFALEPHYVRKSEAEVKFPNGIP
ncbi:MAG: tRNA (adenosine(37)-N6)-threonylcarbamoyltransferase complex dimerization subunit type 1 TsaB [Deltaproteobacteria bacterium]